MIGGMLGFLVFNAHPAKVFMGDTGSLGIGGGMAAVAILTKTEILLVLIGGIFVIEMVSVILQVGSFKLRGKRIFKMSPIHHHFELSGWSEWRVVTTFWFIGLIFAALGIALGRYQVQGTRQRSCRRTIALKSPAKGRGNEVSRACTTALKSPAKGQGNEVADTLPHKKSRQGRGNEVADITTALKKSRQGQGNEVADIT